jgi:hypothetical protein
MCHPESSSAAGRLMISHVKEHLATAHEMANEATPIVALIVAALLTIEGIVTLPDAVAFARAAETTDGVITEDLGHRRGWVAFTASDGDTYGFRAYVGEARVGDHIEVTYRSDAPWREASVEGALGPLSVPAAGFGFGLLGLLFGVTALRSKRRRAAKASRPS